MLAHLLVILFGVFQLAQLANQFALFGLAVSVRVGRIRSQGKVVNTYDTTHSVRNKRFAVLAFYVSFYVRPVVVVGPEGKATAGYIATAYKLQGFIAVRRIRGVEAKRYAAFVYVVGKRSGTVLTTRQYKLAVVL